jgi:hypothetical protein
MIYLQTIKKFFNVYFTNFPYNHYNLSTKYSNFGLIGISYELIYAQQTFWLANICSFVFIYNIKNKDFFYYNIFMLGWSISLYLISFKKVINIIKYI